MKKVLKIIGVSLAVILIAIVVFFLVMNELPRSRDCGVSDQRRSFANRTMIIAVSIVFYNLFPCLAL